MKARNLVILGSTGSIGVSALDVVRRHKKKLRVLGLAAHQNVDLMLKQIREFRPKVVALHDSGSSGRLERIVSGWRKKPLVLNHGQGVQRMASLQEADVVLCSMVGGQGLLPLVAALKAGKTVCLANKEPLVIAGSILMKLSKKYKAPIVPVDSEHSAIFQILNGENHGDIRRLILTASGGPFYRSTKDLDTITVDEALRHPTWKMGKKITIDSATLMNKGLEAIEAHHLFGVPMDRISIVIHPQSIVHSLVEFKDGAMLAQLSHPDMRLPIQYALMHPARMKTPVRPLVLEEIKTLDFADPDFSRFPCLKLALWAGRRGGTAPAVLSASNEEAVRAFISRRITFMSIPRIISQVLKKQQIIHDPSLNDILGADAWAREEARRVIERSEKKI